MYLEMGHHKLRLLIIPFAIFVYLISGFIFFGEVSDKYRLGLTDYMNPIAITCMFLTFFVLKSNQKFLLFTFLVVLVTFVLNGWNFIQLMAGNMNGEKSLVTLYLIPLGAFFIYFYYEVFDD